MAIGDKAAAKSLAVFASSQAHSLGYQNDNQRGDELADEIDARTAGDNARMLKADHFIQDATPANIAGTGYSGRTWTKRA